MKVVIITMPLWAHGLDNPVWLFAPRATNEPTVVFANIDGPLAVEQTDIRNTVFPLLDELWLHTSVNAVAAVWTLDERKRLVFLQRQPIDGYDVWRRTLPASASTLVTGFAAATIEAGLELYIARRGAAEQRVAGSLAAVRTALVDALGARRVESHLREMPAIQRAAYAELCEAVFRQIAANPNSTSVMTVPKTEHRTTVALACDVAVANPASEVAQLVWFTSAIYAHAAGGLHRSQRRDALAAVRAFPADADAPLRRLAPAILLGLGEVREAHADARAALAALGTSADRGHGPFRTQQPLDDGYRAWLERQCARTV